MKKLVMLKAKLHRAKVTGVFQHYEGSITIDKKLMEKVSILPFEQVEVYNITNGARFTTYAIEGKDGEISINGAAAHLAKKGDLIIICAYCLMDEEEAKNFKPKILILDEENRAK